MFFLTIFYALLGKFASAAVYYIDPDNTNTKRDGSSQSPYKEISELLLGQTVLENSLILLASQKYHSIFAPCYLTGNLTIRYN